ncbi:integumentary mucin C.1-like isoform X2 [Mya arenaria]|uniref:integumentary mucin C.1-like isoform X2 n=1 Tax=Mya arenaria TaxID=6604 RepID=UPI0022E30106|nr:integumentary mucin C.1-like isoform X2 [Mya arenaria]
MVFVCILLLPAVLLYGASAEVDSACNPGVCANGFVCENNFCKIPASGNCTEKQTTQAPPTTTATKTTTATSTTTTAQAGSSPAADTTTQPAAPTTETTTPAPEATTASPSVGRRKREASPQECVANALCLPDGEQLTCHCNQGYTADSNGSCQQDNAGSQYKASTWVVFGAAILLMMIK